MEDEVKFSIYSDEANTVERVTQEDFIRLFVNHRPVYGIGKNNIEDAFRALATTEKGTALSRGKLVLELIILFQQIH